jgi:hypothetical protein
MSPKFTLIRQVLAEVVRTGRPEIVRQGDVEATFGDVEAFLLALHHRWRTAFLARLDALLEDPPDDLDAAVVALWTDPTTGGRGLRALLDAYADHQALATAQDRERRMVLRDVGVDVGQSSPARAVAHHTGRRWWRGAA